MSIKVKFIAPYPSMVQLIEEVKHNEKDLIIDVEVGNLLDGVKIAQEAEKEGYDIIISRGGTAWRIRESVAIPVIDTNMSGYDMLRVLTLANDFQVKKALVGYPTMTMGAQAIIDLLEYPVDLYTMEHFDEIDTLIPSLQKAGYTIVIGDVGTMEAANKYGMEGLLIQSGRETIVDAFEKARQQYWYHQHNLSINRLLVEALKEKGEDFVIFSYDRKLISETWNEFDQCPLTKAEVNELLKDARNMEKVHWRRYLKGTFQVDVKVKNIQAYGDNYTLLSFVRSEQQLKSYSWVEEEVVKQKPTIIHQSYAMDGVMQVIDGTKKSHQLFFLVGETGSGRGMIARYIHFLKEDNRVLLDVDASRCDFDELEELLPAHAQTIFLRNVHLLKEQQYIRLSSFITEAIEREKTVIVSTNESFLHHMESPVANRGVEIFIPPLRNRMEDLKGLVMFFIAYFHQNIGTDVIKVQEEAVEVLKAHHWVGNVRELQSFMQTVVMAERGYVLKATHIQSYLEGRLNSEQTPLYQLDGTLEDMELKIIQSVLEEENFNQSKAAKRLGINRSTLWRKLKNGENF
ncbi:sigma-54-dependent Fis family transcriptional regulator [Halalkalibacillus halophilus]|uniref:sigma-54-dependent Fis family transcriptional regulator n=1 Tax=Halalkalibacillus halophilus TaxID=392827 RepID=UPI000429E5E6|nr:sigma-54-dependent Fis family transcriptional regulator [Halalkalibacillus halophilus]